MKSKHSLAAGLLLLMAVAAGCSSKEPENIPAVNTEKVQDTKKADEEEVEPERKEDTEKEADFVIPEQGEEHLSGKVRNLGNNSVTISKIFVEENENSDIVYLPEEGSQEEELVTVNFRDDTEFHFWVIKNCGGDIDMRESSFSEIQEGFGLEMYGNYDGDSFIASKVIIEVYE